MSVFDLREMLDMAIRDEESGEAFYAALAETAKDQKLKDRFQAIAAQERYHAARFRTLLTELGAYKPVKQTYTGEYEEYMGAMLAARAFTTPQEAAAEARKMGAAADAVNTALRMESDTLLFYMEIRGFVETKMKSIVDDIIHEEKEHVYELTQIKKSL